MLWCEQFLHQSLNSVFTAAANSGSFGNEHGRVVQVMIAELMQHWGSKGLDTHLKSLQTVYKRRAQLMHNSAKQVPTCGCLNLCFSLMHCQ